SQGIVDRAAVQRTDVVLEIGPGTGNLTVRLLEKASATSRARYSPQSPARIRRHLPLREWEKTLQIIQGDVLKVPLPFFDVLVANVPYNVS
ncbi:unnamed protein product, partial [Scytosiphon promiscuus]